MEAYEGKTMRLSPVCPMCRSAMEPGFLLERGDDMTRHQVEWAQGEPQKRSMWLGGGVHTKNVRRYAVSTLRCEGCGFLASYAIEPLNDV